MMQSILESVRDIETEGKPVVENILYNVVNAMIAAHAEHATSVRRFVNDLAIKVDHDTSSIDVKQFVKAKIQLDQPHVRIGGTVHHAWVLSSHVVGRKIHRDARRIRQPPVVAPDAPDFPWKTRGLDWIRSTINTCLYSRKHPTNG